MNYLTNKKQFFGTKPLVSTRKTHECQTLTRTHNDRVLIKCTPNEKGKKWTKVHHHGKALKEMTALQRAKALYNKARKLKNCNRKTKMCTFHSKGRCNKGHKCSFAHTKKVCLIARNSWMLYKKKKVQEAAQKVKDVLKQLRKPKKQQLIVLKAWTVPGFIIKPLKKAAWQKRVRKKKMEAQRKEKLSWKDFDILDKLPKMPKKTFQIIQKTPSFDDFKPLVKVDGPKLSKLTSWVEFAQKPKAGPTQEERALIETRKQEQDKKDKELQRQTKLYNKFAKKSEQIQKDMVLESEEDFYHLQHLQDDDSWQDNQDEEDDWENDFDAEFKDEFGHLDVADESHFEHRR